MKGCFIVFEGIDGSGKTTQFFELEKKLKADNYKVVITREPTTNRPIGKLIRRILYNHTEVSDHAIALLFAADRADHTENKIIPDLKEGSIVLSDRYVYSSFSYQSRGMSTEIDLKWIQTINRYAIRPDLVIFLDVPPQEGLERFQKVQQRVYDDKYFEDLIIQEKIRSVYYKILKLDRIKTNLWEYHDKKRVQKKEKLIQLNGTQVLRVDGTLPKEKISDKIYEIVKTYLEEKNINTKTKDKFTDKKLIQFS